MRVKLYVGSDMLIIEKTASPEKIYFQDGLWDTIAEVFPY